MAEDVEMRLQAPRVSINGKLDDASTRVMADVTGSVVWIYVPKRGRFMLSRSPNERSGFRKAGEVRGSALQFAVGRNTFSVASGGRIAPGQAAFNLYVRHEPGWVPTYANANVDAFIIGAVVDRGSGIGDQEHLIPNPYPLTPNPYKDLSF